MADKSRKNNVDLGFLDECDSSRLLSHHFPSKVGGRPAWLSLKPLPAFEDLSCTKCGKISTFLLQVYCPDENLASTFHRTVFIFVCRNAECSSKNSNKNFRIYRSQLQRSNAFYSADPPKENEALPESMKNSKLCCVCGVTGPKTCSRCHKATYCSQEHQIIDWKNGHKTKCSIEEQPSSDKGNIKGILFPEFELVMEDEIFQEKDKEKSEADKWKEYEQFMQSEKAKSIISDEKSTGHLENMSTSANVNDERFSYFKKRIEQEPEQVLRYQIGDSPLWVSNEGLPTEDDIPPCQCGAKRRFEFQVMPQLLSSLDVDRLESSLDWGTLVIYTCSANCDHGNKYHQEFLWKQDFS